MKPRSKKRTPTQHNNLKLADVQPLTDNQEAFFNSYDEGKHQVLLGFAGTGKTFSALYKAFKELDEGSGSYSITIVRTTVPTRDQGFLKGTVAEKEEVYELPYKQICNDLFGRADAYELLKKKGIIKFISTSFIRGTTLDNTIVIMDEFQSATFHELDSVITRIGLESRMIFCGDLLQSDLVKESERHQAGTFLSILENLPKHFNFTYFTPDDIVRSGLVKDFIIQKTKQGITT